MTGEKRAIPTCREVFEGLGEWCEGSLPAHVEAPYHEHLDLCPPCGRIARTYQALSRVAASALETRMPDDAKGRLYQALAARLCRGR